MATNLTKTLTLKIDGVDKAINSVEELNKELLKVDKNATIDLEIDPTAAVKDLKVIQKTINDVAKESKADFNAVKTSINEALNPKKIIDNFKQVSDEVGLTAAEARELGKVLKDLSPRSDEFVQASALLKTFREDVTGAKEGAAALAAELGAFDAGSLDDLNAQLRFYQGEMDGAVAGTEKFVQSGNKIDELKLKIEALSKTPKEQKKLFTDLGVSIGSTFTTGAATLQSFTGDNEDAAAAILKIQQALALVETVKAAIESIQLARQAVIIAQTKQQTASTLELASAQEVQTVTSATAGKSGGLLSNGLGFVTKGIRTAIGAVRAFTVALLSNPIGLIAAGVVALGVVLFALKDKIKPIQQAFDFLSDGVSGLVGFFGDLFSSTEKVKNLFITLLPVIAAPLIPIGLLIEGAMRLAKAFGFLEDTPTLFETYKNAVVATGKGIQKEIKLAERKRILAVQEANAEILKTQEDLEIKRLSVIAGNEEKIFEIKKKQLERDRALGLARTIVEAKLTQSEIDIIKSGDAEKIASLELRLKKAGRLNEASIESLKKFQESEIALAEETQKEKERIINRDLARANLRRDLEIQRIEDSNRIADKIRVVETQLQKQLAEFQARRAKGEAVTNEEIILARQAAYKSILALEQVLEDERIKISENTSDILLDQQIKALEEQDTLAAKIRAKDLQLAEDRKDIDEQLAKDIAEFPDLEVELTAQANAEKLARQNQYYKDVNQLREDDFQKQKELEKRRLDATKNILNSEADAAQAIFENDSNTFQKRVESINDFTDKRLEALDKETADLLNQEGLSAEEREAIEKDHQNKRFGIIKDGNDKLDGLNKDLFNKEKKDADDALALLNKKFQEAQDLAAAYSQAAFAVYDTINSVITAQEEQQLSALEKRTETIQELLDETNQKAEESASKQEELTNQLATANEKDRARIVKQLDREAAREARLQKQKIKQEAELKKVEEEKRKIQKEQFERNKVAAIIQSVIATALAVVSALGSIPFGPQNIALAVAAGIAGAAATATIAAQPTPEFAEGGFTGPGTLPDSTGHKVAGIVHDGEWVAPKWMVNSPKFSPVIQEMESHRYRGYAQGGFVSSPTIDNSGVMNQLAQTNANILKIAQTPIVVDVRQVTSEQQRVAQVVSNARL